MKQIGIAGMECFDGPCDPWSKYCCRSCSIRPIKVYMGNNGHQPFIDIAKEYGLGAMISPQNARNTKNLMFPYYALDNGKFSAWKNDEEWNEKAFWSLIEKHMKADQAPDFVVVPDIVAGGLESLEFSIEYLHKLPKGWTKYFLAVQDGMTIDDVEPYKLRFDGFFIGGTLKWKYRTAKKWVEFAHDGFRQLPCHIGRVGTHKKVLWARKIGVDSIDSTSWPRNNTFHHVLDANKQPCVESG